MGRVDELIDALELKPHPEGGYYAEAYRSAGAIPGSVLPAGFGGDRSYSTSIFFLLREGEVSGLHRLKSDEGWFFHMGGPLNIVQISPQGKVGETKLGADLANGQKLQHFVPAGDWFGAYPCEGSAFTLVGCTVSPGFDYRDFELGKRSDLLRTFPSAKDVIIKLTPES